jgi:hypothetical protein
MASAWRSFCFETTNSGWPRLRRSPALSSPVALILDRVFNAVSLLKAAEAAGLGDPGKNLSQKTKRAKREADFTRLASAHRQDVVDLSRKPKMIKDLSHRAAEFAIEPIQERRLGWDNESIVSFGGRGE